MFLADRLVLGASLHDILTRLKAEPHRFPRLDLTYSPTNPILDPVVLSLPANGLRLRFDGPEQRLRLVEVLDFTKNHIFFREQNKDRDLVKPPGANGETTSTAGPTGGPTFRHIYSRFLGPTYDGEYVPPETSSSGRATSASGMGTYVLSYPGVAFTFPMAPSAYTPDKDVVSLLSTPSNLSAVSMAVFSGDSWAQARDTLWTEALPPIKSFAPVSKGKDVSPDEVSLVKIHGGGKLQLFRRWAPAASHPASGTSGINGNGNGNADSNGNTVTAPASSADTASSYWITLGETTPQDLVSELGPPDAIYRKSDQRMYIHKIRTASSTRQRPNGFDRQGHGGYRRADDALTDTDQSSVPTASSDEDDLDDVVEDELITGNVSAECFFNYFYLGFDVLVSTPTPPSRIPPSHEATGAAAANGIPTSALRHDASDTLVATKVVLHGNVPGSYPFNRHRRCRWSIAYVDKAGRVNSESPFADIQTRLRAEWASIYASEDEAKQKQRGMVLNRGWGDSPGSSIELLGGWEEGQRTAGAGDEGGLGGRGAKGAEESTTTLFGFPGLVFEVLRNGFVSAVTVF